jgi:hypothetical protein
MRSLYDVPLKYGAIHRAWKYLMYYFHMDHGLTAEQAGLVMERLMKESFKIIDEIKANATTPPQTDN